MGLNRLTFAYRRNVSVKQVSGFVPYVYTLQQQPCMHRVPQPESPRFSFTSKVKVLREVLCITIRFC